MGSIDSSRIKDLWVFGYGSIIWKNSEVERSEELPAYIHGYKRRFWQNSPDHRGTCESPGLVVSIYPPREWDRLNIDDQDLKQFPDNERDEWSVHGRAFRVTPAYRDKVSKI